MNSAKFIYLSPGWSWSYGPQQDSEINVSWFMAIALNQIMRSDVSMCKKQIRTVISIELPEKDACLLAITAHYACLSLLSARCLGLICLRYFEEGTCNYFCKRTCSTHRETLRSLSLCLSVLEMNHSLSSFQPKATKTSLIQTLHVITRVAVSNSSRPEEAKIQQRPRIFFSLRNCQLKTLQAINQNIYNLLCKCEKIPWKSAALMTVSFTSLISQAKVFSHVHARRCPTTFCAWLVECITF